MFAQLGLQVGTRRIARMARRMGIRTPISTNPAMTLGGLQEGVTPLEMAYAYSTIANNGMRRSGTLAPGKDGPVGVEWVKGQGRDEENKVVNKRVFSPEVAALAQQMLEGVVSSGTGKAAQIGEFAAGKTGTTENYGDAWFVGFNKELTVAVWVGYPDRLTPMQTEYHGEPVAGGTFPAEIWHDLMLSWIGIRDQRRVDQGRDPNATTRPPPPRSRPGRHDHRPEHHPRGGDRGRREASRTSGRATSPRPPPRRRRPLRSTAPRPRRLRRPLRPPRPRPIRAAAAVTAAR